LAKQPRLFSDRCFRSSRSDAIDSERVLVWRISPTATLRLVPYISFLTALVLYTATAARTITWRNRGTDGGDLITAAWTWGIPHPTGYPFYVLLGHILTSLPFGTPAFRVELLSIVPAAIACGLVTSLALTLTASDGTELGQTGFGWSMALRRAVGAIGAGLCLGCSEVFWMHATVVETYALNIALVAFALGALLAYVNGQRGAERYALWQGLALANHLISISLVAPAGVLLLWHVFRGSLSTRRLIWSMMAALPGLSCYLLLLLRARTYPVANWGVPVTPDRLLAHLSAREYAYFLQPESAHAVLVRVLTWPELALTQFGWFGLGLAGVGLTWIAMRKRVAGALLFGLLGSNIVITALDAAPTTPNYFLVSYLVLALGIGCAFQPCTRLIKHQRVLHPWMRVTLTWLVALAPLAVATQLVFHNAPVLNLRSDTIAEEWMNYTLAQAPRRSLIIVSGDAQTFTLWYGHDVLGLSPDAIIWSRELALLPWYAELQRRRYPDLVIPSFVARDEDGRVEEVVRANLDARPVVTTEEWPVLLQHYQFRQLGNVSEIRRRSSADVERRGWDSNPRDLSSTDFPGRRHRPD